MNFTNDKFYRQPIGSSRLSGLGFVATALLVAAAAVAGCGDSEATGGGGQGAEGGTNNDGGSGAQGGLGGQGAQGGAGGEGAQGGSGGAGGEGGGPPTKPADCDVLSLSGIDLLSKMENAPDSADVMPVVRTSSTQENVSGDATMFDRLQFLFDGNLDVGTHQFDGVLDHIVPNGTTTYTYTCNAGAIYQEDLDETIEEPAYTRAFAAKAGELEIEELVTPHQTQGVFRYVELREVAPNVDTQVYEWKDGGKCYWIEEAAYDVRRPNGCLPFTDGACPADQFCMPVVASGIDGECVTGGDKAVGEACTFVNDTTWDSDCELGLRCFDEGEGGTCYQVCDIFSATHGCPDDTHCGGGYNLCMPLEDLTNSGVDPAALGETCSVDPSALYCGGTGQPGMCWDDDQDGPMESTCYPWHAAPSECVAPQTAGTVQYKNGIDASTVWCVTPYEF
ncbi:MAG: hypothetical protein HOW73_33120 [Polyangiaceae bacterium]|nr:hypothetical protein [Polyangiaceae bacterium]